jgi:hypothetical protein
MKKTILSLFLFVACLSVTASDNLVTVDKSTTIAQGKDFVVLTTTDNCMAVKIADTTDVYMSFSSVEETGTCTVIYRFYYPIYRRAYIVTRAYSIVDFACNK